MKEIYHTNLTIARQLLAFNVDVISMIYKCTFCPSRKCVCHCSENLFFNYLFEKSCLHPLLFIHLVYEITNLMFESIDLRRKKKITLISFYCILNICSNQFVNICIKGRYRNASIFSYK